MKGKVLKAYNITRTDGTKRVVSAFRN